MKRSILMILVMSAALIFFGCEKETIQPPGSDQYDLEETALKGAKVGLAFEGICRNVLTNEDVNQWYDDTDDWRTTGNSYWVQPDPSVFEGTAELIVDDEGGKWEMTWEGTLTPKSLNPEDGFDIIAEAEGKGVEGKVKGMKASWTYTMDFDGTPATFYYAVEGVIKKTGHLKQRKRQQ